MEDSKFDISKSLKELLKLKGFSVGMNTPVCDNHHKFAPDCVGCECEQGCSRLCHMLGALAKGMLYEPVSFEDYQRMDNWIKKKMDHALDPNFSLAVLREEE